MICSNRIVVEIIEEKNHVGFSSVLNFYLIWFRVEVFFVFNEKVWIDQ